MREEHVTRILDEAPLGRLGKAELAHVREHASRCAECRRAYEAALVASLLVRERAAEEVAPSPFFQTRVLAALRERRAEDAPAWRRMWRAAGALVSSMAAAVVLLAGLTFVAPDASQGETAASDAYSTDAVLLEQAFASDDEISDGQVFEAIYVTNDAEEDYGQDR